MHENLRNHTKETFLNCTFLICLSRCNAHLVLMRVSLPWSCSLGDTPSETSVTFSGLRWVMASEIRSREIRASAAYKWPRNLRTASLLLSMKSSTNELHYKGIEIAEKAQVLLKCFNLNTINNIKGKKRHFVLKMSNTIHSVTSAALTTSKMLLFLELGTRRYHDKPTPTHWPLIQYSNTTDLKIISEHRTQPLFLPSSKQYTWYCWKKQSLLLCTILISLNDKLFATIQYWCSLYDIRVKINQFKWLSK